MIWQLCDLAAIHHPFDLSQREDNEHISTQHAGCSDPANPLLLPPVNLEAVQSIINNDACQISGEATQASSYSTDFLVDQGVGGNLQQPVQANVVIFQPIDSMRIAGSAQKTAISSEPDRFGGEGKGPR
jgi:hypothetical protein